MTDTFSVPTPSAKDSEAYYRRWDKLTDQEKATPEARDASAAYGIDKTHTRNAIAYLSSLIYRRGPIVLNETVTVDEDYYGHWIGTAYITHHTYGEQIHRTRGDAERWNTAQAKLRPAPHVDVE